MLLESDVVQNVNDDIVKLHIMCYDIVCLHSVWNYIVLLESWVIQNVNVNIEFMSVTNANIHALSVALSG